MKWVLILLLISGNCWGQATAELAPVVITGTSKKKSNEAECKTKFVDTSNLPKNRYQNGLKWCHAFSLADLLSFYTKKRISAYGIAVDSYHNKSTFTQAQNKNLIVESDSSPLQNFSYLTLGNKDICLESNFKVGSNEWKNLSPLLAEIETEEGLVQAKSYNLLCNKNKGLTKIINEQFKKLSGTEMLTKLIKDTCQNRTQLPKGELVSDSSLRKIKCFNNGNTILPSDRNKICKIEPQLALKGKLDFSILDEKLNKNEPGILLYDHNPILLLKYDNENAESTHGSLVIGRKFNKDSKECEYLIRNNWGTNCKIYPKEIQKKCVSGNIWVAKEDLESAASTILTFNPQEK